MPTKTLAVNALRATFDGAYPIDQFQGLKVGIDFPVEKQQYPGIWVDFEPQGTVKNAGVGHVEYTAPDENGAQRELLRWRFQGFLALTAVALESAVRDALFDEIIRLVAFGTGDPIRSRFRAYVENNDLIALNIDWDEISTQAGTEVMGTPWGTDDVIYENTLRLEALGEFVSPEGADELYAITQVVLHPYAEGQPDPLPDPAGWT